MTEMLHWYAETTGGVRQGDAPVHPGCGASFRRPARRDAENGACRTAVEDGRRGALVHERLSDMDIQPGT